MTKIKCKKCGSMQFEAEEVESVYIDTADNSKWSGNINGEIKCASCASYIDEEQYDEITELLSIV